LVAARAVVAVGAAGIGVDVGAAVDVGADVRVGATGVDVGAAVAWQATSAHNASTPHK
jgi:hypothetical protein